MKKKQTKRDRELAALRKRIDDIYLGATGQWCVPDDYCLDFEHLARVLNAVEAAFITKKTDTEYGNEYLLMRWNFRHYYNPELLTKFLFEHGVRA